MKKYIRVTVLVITSSFLCAFVIRQTKPWIVPEKFVKMTNPVKADDEALKNGKALWIKHCQSCHGKTGLGDGTKAATLETPVEDLTIEEIQKQSDGSLFYKITEGRDEMPTFKKKIPDDEERWQIVKYIRTLKAK